MILNVAANATHLSSKSRVIGNVSFEYTEFESKDKDNGTQHTAASERLSKSACMHTSRTIAARGALEQLLEQLPRAMALRMARDILCPARECVWELHFAG